RTHALGGETARRAAARAPAGGARGARRAGRPGAARDERGHLGVARGAEPADDGDRDERGDASGDLLDLGRGQPAPRALLQVLAQAPLRAGAQPAPGVGAELVGVPGAALVLGEGGADVGLEVGLLQAL